MSSRNLPAPLCLCNPRALRHGHSNHLPTRRARDPPLSIRSGVLQRSYARALLCPPDKLQPWPQLRRLESEWFSSWLLCHHFSIVSRSSQIQNAKALLTSILAHAFSVRWAATPRHFRYFPPVSARSSHSATLFRKFSFPVSQVSLFIKTSPPTKSSRMPLKSSTACRYLRKR